MNAVLRLFALPVVALLAMFGLVAHAWAVEPPRTAMGVIVKFKDPSPQAKSLSSILRLQASVIPSESAQRLRTRVEALKVRHRLPAMQHKPTAFAAQLIHAGRPTTLAEAQAMAARLRADPEVEWAVPNELLRPLAATVTGQTFTVSNLEFQAQPWLKRRADAPVRLGYANFPAAWDRLAGLTLHPVVVAVLDTGILPLSDLAGRTFPGWDFVSDFHYARDGDGVDADPRDEGDWLTASEKLNDPTHFDDPCKAQDSLWHGLAITNMLAALPGNNLTGGVGILSPLPNEVVLPVRVAGTCGASTNDIIEGMLWAAGIDYQGAPARNVYPARVINISLGGEGNCASTSLSSADWLYRQTVERLRRKGVLVVAAAGNGDGDNKGQATLSRPASCDGVLAVTGLNAQGYKAVYANLANSSRVGGSVTRLKAHALAVASGDVSAGFISDDGIRSVVDSSTTSPSSTYQEKVLAGTSFATPMVSGVAALMLAVDPSITVDELRNVLSNTDQTYSVLDTFPAPSGGMPVCDPDSARENCHCTFDTCGGGILNADKAIEWAVARTLAGPPGPSAYDDTPEYFSEFTPQREEQSSSGGGGGGGGGGAMDALALLALGGAWGVRCLMRRHRQARVTADRR